MIPLRDNIIARKLPIVTAALIAVNVAVFLMCAIMPEHDLQALLFRYGLIPAKIFRPAALVGYYYEHFGFLVPRHYSLGESLLPLLTCTFLHGGVLHLVGNMWILWIFGDNVEDCLGHVGYLFFYVACGLASSIVQVISNPVSPIVTIGASGAIAGVMGAYLVLYPAARVMTFVWFFIYIDVWPIPAFVFLFYWFAIQLLSGVAAFGAGDLLHGGVAWWAHIGGFAAGFGFILLSGIRPGPKALRTYRRPRYYFDPRRGRYVALPRSNDEG